MGHFHAQFFIFIEFWKVHWTWSWVVGCTEKKTICCSVPNVMVALDSSSYWCQNQTKTKTQLICSWQTFLKYVIEICFNWNVEERMKTKYLFLRSQSTGGSWLWSEQLSRWFGSSSWRTVAPPGGSALDSTNSRFWSDSRLFLLFLLLLVLLLFLFLLLFSARRCLSRSLVLLIKYYEISFKVKHFWNYIIVGNIKKYVKNIINIKYTTNL